MGFAKVAFQADTGISDAAFAFGAGVFFVGYALLEVPSNLIMHRIGARIWMCRIMVTWGLVSAAMMFAHNEIIFYVLRFLLGVAEAGFSPASFCTSPTGSRRHTVRKPWAFSTSARRWPLSLAAPVGPAAGARWHGWLARLAVAVCGRGLMAVAVGIWAYFYLTNRPADATWLTDDERRQVQEIIASEERAKGGNPHSLLAALCQPRVLYLALIYLLIQASVYGVVFYLPSQVAGLLGARWACRSAWSRPSWLCALLAAWWVPGFAQRSQKPRTVASVTLLVAAIGMAASVSFSSPLLGVAALCFAAAGFIAVQPVFWTFPVNTLAGAAAAGGIALINSLGAVGGFVAPIVKNWAEGHFHSPASGLYLLAGTTVLAALLVLGIRARTAPAA